MEALAVERLEVLLRDSAILLPLSRVGEQIGYRADPLPNAAHEITRRGLL
ncbi:MAG: hypothetical protein NUW01_08915 [Gemmatimonadaceae bacterium]|nr:hypothetical protein [Gemmatimonadaceae bacterium]